MRNIREVIGNYVEDFVDDSHRNSVWNSVRKSTRVSVRYFINHSFGGPVSDFHYGPFNETIGQAFSRTVKDIVRSKS